MDEKDGLAAETEDEKEQRLSKESEAKVNEIENKTEENGAMYSIYQCFMAASILCAILGVVCIGYLIYMFVSDNNSEENNPLINRPGGGDYGSGGPPGGYGYNEQP